MDMQWLPSAQLTPGTYFKINDRWHLCLQAPEPPPSDRATYAWRVRAVTTDGHIGWRAIHGNRVQALQPCCGRPDVFNPATLRRRAQVDEHNAEALLNQAGLRRRLAQKLESGAQIS